MGCKSSKTAPSHNIRVVQSAGPRGKQKIAPSPDSGSQRSRFASNPDIFSTGKRDSSTDDADSLFGNAESRHSSAGSKVSKHSSDSGFEICENTEWEKIITEDSDPLLVERVEQEFDDQDLDLCVTGTSVRQMKQEREIERQEERDILATLQQEGLLVRPKSRAQGGVSFEITEEDFQPRRPPRLEKLEMTRRKRKKRDLTAAEIQAKLEKAEQRRKRKEQERIERINAKQRKEQDDVLTALEAFQEHQKRTEEGVLKRLGSASENREKRRQEMKEKLQAKRQHEEIVRQRRKLAREQGETDNTAESMEDFSLADFITTDSGPFDPRYDDDDEYR